MVKELQYLSTDEGHVEKVYKQDNLNIVSKAAQLVSSIPDKARPDAAPALSAQYPYLPSTWNVH